MKSQLPIVVVAMLSVLFAAPVRADEVVKKDGSSVFGFIVLDTRRVVMVMDKDGRKIRINRSEIESVIEDHQTGNEAVDAKLNEIDFQDADELVEVAKWAKEEKHRAWKLVAMQALRVDETHDGAHELLGHYKVGDTWYEKKRDADKARKLYIKAKREEEGYIKWRGGWIQKEDRSKASKNPDEWMKDEDDTWVLTAEHMAAKGFIEANGKWVKAGSPEDKKDIEEYLEKTGEKIWVYSSDHFRLWVQGFEPDEVYEQAELCEKTYKWFHELYDVPNDGSLWRGNKVNFFIFEQKQSATEWFNQYRGRFGLDDNFLNLMISGSGTILSSGRLIAVHTVPNDEAAKQHVPHQLVNHAAHCLMQYYSPGLPMPQGATARRDSWLGESFGVYAEHVLLKRGLVLHSTNQRYAGSGGVADKKFSTEDAGAAAKGTVRAGEDASFVELTKIELNQLSAENMAKGFTLVEWLMKDRADDFRKFLLRRNTLETPAAAAEVFGMSPAELDAAWRKYVKKKF